MAVDIWSVGDWARKISSQPRLLSEGPHKFDDAIASREWQGHSDPPRNTDHIKEDSSTAAISFQLWTGNFEKKRRCGSYLIESPICKSAWAAFIVGCTGPSQIPIWIMLKQEARIDGRPDVPRAKTLFVRWHQLRPGKNAFKNRFCRGTEHNCRREEELLPALIREVQRPLLVQASTIEPLANRALVPMAPLLPFHAPSTLNFIP
ncbi:FeS_assembly_P domain-containing protein [Psidium guajava]|nr:FeS_assembly_P domain-containing protein [Psidium guajava]